ncbi:MAG: GNAT family N-acetyltransferase [Candidatus Bipolaricaulota bacterium]|nr:GNAT family N-acetyltransferase [Candidatus Bipolaricaulota bacterium]
MSTKEAKSLSTRCVPLTFDRWPDFEKLFGPRGAQAGCWCMWWRETTSEFEARKGKRNREAFQAIVASGDVPGLLAYVGDEPVGWCAVAPRERYVRLARSRTLKPIDEQPVWSITCFFVARRYRRQGVTARLLDAVVAFVRDRGGHIVEAYPIAPASGEYPAAYAYTGLLSTFLAAGFQIVARPSASRAVVRHVIEPPARPSRRRGTSE